MSGNQLVYIDTNVFAIILLPHPLSQDAYIKQANEFMGDIENGKYTGITSTLTEMEYRGVAKRRISDKKKGEISHLEEEFSMGDFNRLIYEMGIGLIDADIIAPDISGELKLFRNSDNTIQKSRPVHVNGQWKMIRSMDALMVNLAIRARANLFATFDRGFRGLGDSSITPLIISEAY